MLTMMKFPSTFARNNAVAGAGETRYASSTWLRSSRAQVWFRATTAANKNATQTRPPTMRRDSSASGSKEKTKITTTSREKNSMALSASLERHSRRISLASVTSVIDQNEVMVPPPGSNLLGPDREQDDDCGPRSARPASRQIRRLLPRAAQ